MNLEALEHRRLFALVVEMDGPGEYRIEGTSGDDAIDVYIDQNNLDSETGLPPFLFEGTYYPSAVSITINGNDGNDSINVQNLNDPGFLTARVNGGAGSDSISMGVDGIVWGGTDDDSITLTDSYRGEANGEDGNDIVYITGACVDAYITGGDGDDYIDCSGSLAGVTARGGIGADTIIGSDSNDQIFGDEGADLLIGNGGQDQFYASGGDTVVGGSGFDNISVDGNLSDITHDCESVS